MLSTADMVVQRRDGPRRLREIDDDDGSSSSSSGGSSGGGCAVEQVLDQLDTLSDASTENYLGDERVLDEVERTCFAVYAFLQAKAAASSVHRRGLEEALAGRYFVLAHGRFLSPKQLAFELAAPACAPYLYAVPDTYRRRYPALLRLAGVRDRFDAGDFVLALQVE